MTTKAEFLGRIREQVRGTPGRFAASSCRRPEHPAAEAETIRRELAERWPETRDAFGREFESVGGLFYRVASVDMIPAVVARIAHEREARELRTASGVARCMVWCSPGFRTGQAANFSRYSLGVRYPRAECGRSPS